MSLLGHDMGIYITSDWKLPVIMVGFGMFLLFGRVTFHNRTINQIAQSAFDFIRQALFAVTIDRCRGHWFDLLWNKTANRISKRISD